MMNCYETTMTFANWSFLVLLGQVLAAMMPCVAAVDNVTHEPAAVPKKKEEPIVLPFHNIAVLCALLANLHIDDHPTTTEAMECDEDDDVARLVAKFAKLRIDNHYPTTPEPMDIDYDDDDPMDIDDPMDWEGDIQHDDDPMDVDDPMDIDFDDDADDYDPMDIDDPMDWEGDDGDIDDAMDIDDPMDWE
jgi:hypothetical protein